MGRYSKYKNYKNLCMSDFVISGCSLISMVQNAVVKGMFLSEDEKKMKANEFAFRLIKQWNLQEVNEREKENK